MTSRRWFHQNLSGLEAEDLLMARGRDGSFLCRPSTNKIDYTLSVRKSGSITHIKIQNKGDHFVLPPRRDPFPTLASLVQYYMENKLYETNGEPIQLLYPLNCKEPTTERWFHGHISSKDAEKLMLDRGKNGSYMVRESVTKPGSFVVTARTDDIINHVMIRSIDGYYDVGGGPKFSTISELINHYRQNPMVEKKGGTVVHLKQPLNSTKFTAASIVDRVAELQKESDLCPGKDGFWEEFEQLQQQEYKHKSSKKIGCTAENKQKNVFKMIVPFDDTRVILRDDPEHDYINASYVTVDKYYREYIATQACLDDTINDFWRMVYNEYTNFILMGMKLIEKGKKRCAKYWPDLSEELKVGNLSVICRKELQSQEFVLREFDLTCDDENNAQRIHRVYHYQFLGWPEHGIPENIGSILGILHDINLKQKTIHQPGPLIVQCGNGIGRSATFIVIDLLLKMVQENSLDCELDIQKTVQQVRSQRPNMVQLEGQYKFIYLVLAHYVEMENHHRHISQPSKPPEPAAPAIPERPPVRTMNSHRPPLNIPNIAINGEQPPPTPPPRNPSQQSGPPSLLGLRLVKDVPDSPGPGTPPARPPPRAKKP